MNKSILTPSKSSILFDRDFSFLPPGDANDDNGIQTLFPFFKSHSSTFELIQRYVFNPSIRIDTISQILPGSSTRNFTTKDRNANTYLFVNRDCDEVKIGLSINPLARANQFRKSKIHRRRKLIFVGVFFGDIEKILHCQFDYARIWDRRSEYDTTEWFRLSQIEPDLKAIVLAAAGQGKFAPLTWFSQHLPKNEPPRSLANFDKSRFRLTAEDRRKMVAECRALTKKK